MNPISNNTSTFSFSEKPDFLSLVSPMVFEIKPHIANDHLNANSYNLLNQAISRVISMSSLNETLSRVFAFCFNDRFSWVVYMKPVVSTSNDTSNIDIST